MARDRGLNRYKKPLLLTYLNNENYLFMINESVPGNVTGFVPVKVQYVGKLSSSALYTHMEDFYRK
jgi:hypothetical protein